MHVWTLPLLPIEALLEASDLSKVLPLRFSLGKQGMLVVELVLPVDLGLPYLIGIGIVAERDRIDEQLLSLGELLILVLLAVFDSRPQHLTDARTLARRLTFELFGVLEGVLLVATPFWVGVLL